MFHVYILRGDSGRHYIGQTNDLAARLAQHRNGQTHTTKRLGDQFELLGSRSYATRVEAMAVERRLKVWGKPALAIEFLTRSD